MSHTELAAVPGGTLLDTVRAQTAFAGVSIDSRLLKPGELFIAIRGEKRDGHDFLEQAIAKRAVAVMVEEGNPAVEGIIGRVPVIRVKDTHKALIQLAKNYRDSLTAKFIGITGSNGKTTTKELTYRLIHSVELHSYYSPGNFNNLFGLPLALFAVNDDARVVVLEMGISSRDEMPTLADIVRPDVIILTNIGASHLEFLGTVEAVAQAKLELVKRATRDVVVIVNADDPILMRETRKVREKFVTFGLNEKADFMVDDIRQDAIGVTQVTIQGYRFRLPLVGRHQAYNLLAAYAAFCALGFDFGNIDTETIELDSAPMRGQIVSHEGITFVADCYNANPASVKAGLKAFFELPSSNRRIVVLGDMLELGETSPDYHREIGRLLPREQFAFAILVGPMSKYVVEGALAAGMAENRLVYFESSALAAQSIRTLLQPEDLVYLKASRGIGLESILKVYDKTGGKH